MRTSLKSILDQALQFPGSVVSPHVAIHLNSGTVCLADSPDYETREIYANISASSLTDSEVSAFVLSWGNLLSTLDWVASINSAGVDTKSFYFNIASNIYSRPLIEKLMAEAVEGVYCDLFLNVEDYRNGSSEAPVISTYFIDRLIIQDPFQMSESSSFLSINCMSQNHTSDPLVGDPDGFGSFLPMVLSKDTVIGIPSGSHPFTTLSSDVTKDQNTLPTNAINLLSLGFPASGSVVINMEVIAYTGISGGNTFTGCVREAVKDIYFGPRRKHSSSSEVSLYNHEYLYSFSGISPGDTIGDLYAGTSLYGGLINPNIYSSSSPLQIGFMHKRPHEVLVYPEKKTDHFYGSVTESFENLATGSWYYLNALSSDNGQAQIRKTAPEIITSGVVFGRLEITFSDLATVTGDETKSIISAFASTQFNYYGLSDTVDIITYRVYSGGSVKYTREFFKPTPGVSEEIVAKSLDITSFVSSATVKSSLDVKTTDTSVRTSIIAGLSVYFEKVILSYFQTAETSYIGDSQLSIDVAGSNKLTPASAAEKVLEKKGENGLIDSTSFSAAHSEYVSESYYLAGSLSGNAYCSEGLKDIMVNGFSRLTYSEGKVFFNRLSLDFEFSNWYFSNSSNRVEGSLSMRRTPLDAVVNNVIAKYLDFTAAEGEQDRNLYVKDIQSIYKLGERSLEIDCTLIDDPANVSASAENWLSLLSSPVSSYSFEAGLDAWWLEPGDNVILNSDWLPEGVIAGKVSSVSIKFGSLPDGSPHLAIVEFTKDEKIGTINSTSSGGEEGIVLNETHNDGHGWNAMPWGCAWNV